MDTFGFLICSERSGSNLITSVLNGHSEITGPPPSHLFRLFGLNCENYWPISDDNNWNSFLTDFVDAQHSMLGTWTTTTTVEELQSECKERKIRTAFNYIYAKEARTDSAKIAFVKENYSYLISPFLLTNWPSAFFVYQVRDPRDVASSWIKTKSIPGGVKRAIDNWIHDQTESLKLFHQIRENRNICLLRYEDLIHKPESTCRELCEKINLIYDPEMLNFFQHQRIQLNASRIDAWSNLTKPIIRSNSGKYKNTLTENDIRYIEIRCAHLMGVFGYELDHDVSSLNKEQLEHELKILESDLTETVPFEITSTEREVRNNRTTMINRIKNRRPCNNGCNR